MSQLDPFHTTVGDICTAALKDSLALGVGQTPLAEDTTDAWARLQWMLQEWERQRWLVYHLRTFSIVSTGAQSYTVGPNGQINTNVIAGYGLQTLVLNSGGINYKVGDILNLIGSPPQAAGGSPPSVIVTAVSGGGGTLLLDDAGNPLTDDAGNPLFSDIPSGSGPILSFGIFLPGAIPSPLPTAWNHSGSGRTVLTDDHGNPLTDDSGNPLFGDGGGGSGASFIFPTYFSLPSPILTSRGSERPDRVRSAFLRQLTQSQPNQIDYPMEIIQSKEDYNRLALKQLVAFPGILFYDTDWELGEIFPWPIPQANIYSINITISEQLPCVFPTLATEMVLPWEYYSAVVSNLALRLRPKYGIASFPGDILPSLAKQSRSVLRGANTQIARLVMPPNLNRPGIYNIFSDRSY